LTVGPNEGFQNSQSRGASKVSEKSKGDSRSGAVRVGELANIRAYFIDFRGQPQRGGK